MGHEHVQRGVECQRGFNISDNIVTELPMRSSFPIHLQLILSLSKHGPTRGVGARGFVPKLLFGTNAPLQIGFV